MRERNSVSIRVQRFDCYTATLEGTLEVDLVTPLNSANARVPVRLENREIILTVPLREFYVRQLTGRYSFPIKLDVGKLLNKVSKQPTSSPPNSSCRVRQIVDRSAQLTSIQHEAEVDLDKRLLNLNNSGVMTIWLLGFIPMAVVRQELRIVKAEHSFMSVYVKVHPGGCRAMRVILEAFDEHHEVVTRMNFSEIGPFIYGKVIEFSYTCASSRSIHFIQSRLDVRLARDPTCLLQIGNNLSPS